MTQLRITDDLEALLDVLPADVRRAVEKADDSENLLEIILDLGRVPTARFVDREITLREAEVTRAEIDYVDERTGEFDADNRAGIERTLHRISAIRNRRTYIVGLTLRVGTRGVWHGGHYSRHHRVGQVGIDPRSTRCGQDDSVARSRAHPCRIKTRGHRGYVE